MQEHTLLLDPSSEANTLPLLEHATIQTYKKSDFIFHAGDDADCFYILLEGSVKKLFVNHGGDQKTISIYVSGELFGHLFFGKYRHRISSAYALEDIVVGKVKESDLTRLIQQYPEIGLRLISYLADEQRETLARLHALMHLSARYRLLGTLLSLGRRYCCSEGEWFHLPPISQDDLASLASMNRSTVNILLKDFRLHGIVDGKGKQIQINRHAIEQLLDEVGLEILE